MFFKSKKHNTDPAADVGTENTNMNAETTETFESTKKPGFFKRLNERVTIKNTITVSKYITDLCDRIEENAERITQKLNGEYDEYEDDEFILDIDDDGNIVNAKTGQPVDDFSRYCHEDDSDEECDGNCDTCEFKDECLSEEEDNADEPIVEEEIVTDAVDESTDENQSQSDISATSELEDEEIEDLNHPKTSTTEDEENGAISEETSTEDEMKTEVDDNDIIEADVEESTIETDTNDSEVSVDRPASEQIEENITRESDTVGVAEDKEMDNVPNEELSEETSVDKQPRIKYENPLYGDLIHDLSGIKNDRSFEAVSEILKKFAADHNGEVSIIDDPYTLDENGQTTGSLILSVGKQRFGASQSKAVLENTEVFRHVVVSIPHISLNIVPKYDKRFLALNTVGIPSMLVKNASDSKDGNMNRTYFELNDLPFDVAVSITSGSGKKSNKISANVDIMFFTKLS